MYEHRNFMIFSTSETGSIDFSEVLETSSETLRLNLSGSKSFVKWDGETVPIGRAFRLGKPPQLTRLRWTLVES